MKSNKETIAFVKEWMCDHKSKRTCKFNTQNCKTFGKWLFPQVSRNKWTEQLFADAFAKEKFVFFCVCIGNTIFKVMALQQNIFTSVKVFSCYLVNVFINNVIETYNLTCSLLNLNIIILRKKNLKPKQLWKVVGSIFGAQFAMQIIWQIFNEKKKTFRQTIKVINGYQNNTIVMAFNEKQTSGTFKAFLKQLPVHKYEWL